MLIQQIKNKKGNEFKGLLLITPKIFNDKRGSFYESWNKSVFDNKVNSNINFVQDNHSTSIKGVLRGLHYQVSPFPQGKLVRCVSGEIFDVAVDLRKDSETFGDWIGVNLSRDNKKQIWIPEGFAHGFLTISNNAEVLYKTSDYWNKDCEKSIRWDDETLNINWPMPPKHLSEKDLNLPFLENYDF